MAQNTNSLKKLSLLGLGVLAILFIGGIVFYKERLFFCDASYIAYNILKYDRLFIQQHRYGSFITQIVPLLGGKLHLPIGMVLIAYTLSFNLFYLSVGVVVYYSRQYKLLLLMALTYTLLVSSSYFWTNNEIHQALAWMFLFFAVILRMAECKVRLVFVVPVLLLLGSLTISTHFIVILPMAFLWVYFWLQSGSRYWDSRTYLVLTGCLLLIIVCKFLLVDNNSYDDDHIRNVTHFSFRDIFLAMKADVSKRFIIRLFTIYLPAILVFAGGLYAVRKEGNRRLAAWLVASFVGYMLLMGLAFTNDAGDTALFYIECEWESIAVTMAAPFVYLYLPKLKPKRAIGILSVIFFIRIGYIAVAAQEFTWRTNFKQRVLEQMKKKRITKLALIVPQKTLDKNIINWAMAEESTLMSAAAHEKPQYTFCMVEEGDTILAQELRGRRKQYLSFGLDAKTENQYMYFIIDTTTQYTVQTYVDFFMD